MKKRLQLFVAALLVSAGAMLPNAAQAQFTNNAFYIGPQLGLALGYGSGVLFGANGEIPITNPGTVGSGRLAIALKISYFSWGDGFFSYTFIPIGAFCNYHFALSDTHWDPFIGLGLGFAVISSSYSGPGNLGAGYSSGIYLVGNAGARYWVSPNIAIRADIGLGYTGLGVGVDFKIGS